MQSMWVQMGAFKEEAESLPALQAIRLGEAEEMKNDPNASLGAIETTSDDYVCPECEGMNGFHFKACSAFDAFEFGYEEVIHEG